jgi:hypothetical protein
MRPEFPHWFNPITELMYFNTGPDQAQECDLLKAGMTCGNDTTSLFIGIRVTAVGEYCGYIGIAICDSCQSEYGLNRDQMTGEEMTAYWREKQHEWGVR